MNECNINILHELIVMDNGIVRARLTKIKGIGNRSVDVYLMMVLQLCDFLP